MSDDIAPVKPSRKPGPRFRWLKSLGATQRGIFYAIRCRYCDRPGLLMMGKGYCTYSRATPDPLRFWGHQECMVVDHVVPLSKGGKDDATNYVIACEDCNRRKGSRLDWTAPNGVMVAGKLVK